MKQWGDVRRKAASFAKTDVEHVRRAYTRSRTALTKINASIRVVLTLLVALLIVLASAALWLRPSGFEEGNEFVRTVAQVVGGFALLAGLYFTAESVRNSAKTLDHQRDSRLHERYFEAIEQLDHQSEAVHIGALYSLKSLFAESVIDRESIAEVLIAFLRDRTDSRDQDDPDLPQDVDRAIHVLCDINRIWRLQDGKGMFKLDKLDLHGISIIDADFDFMSLSGSNFSGGDFFNCGFRGCVMSKANFNGAYFFRCDFRNVYPIDPDFRGADMIHCLNVTWALIADSRIDEKTKLPDYLLKLAPKWYIARFGIPPAKEKEEVPL